MRRGAGGTDGGVMGFVIGFVMICAGGYLLLRGITIQPVFGFGRTSFMLGGFPVTSGMVMVPFMFGVGIIFYDASKWYGWALAAGSLIALIFGVISSLQFQFARMTAFDLIVILMLLVGGIGLFLRSLRASKSPWG